MGISRSLQTFIVTCLKADAGVKAVVSDRIYDAPPSDAAFPYVSIGPSDYVSDDADCIDGREETIQVDCWCRDQGRKGPCKDLADAVKKALHGVDGSLSAGALVWMTVRNVRVIDDPDGITAHGVVTVSATVED